MHASCRGHPRWLSAPPLALRITARSEAPAPGTRFAFAVAPMAADLMLRFERGTLVIDGAWADELPGVLWDPRSSSRRAAAHRFGALVAEASLRGAAVTGDLRDGWAPTPRSARDLGLGPSARWEVPMVVCVDVRHAPGDLSPRPGLLAYRGRVDAAALVAEAERMLGPESRAPDPRFGLRAIRPST